MDMTTEISTEACPRVCRECSAREISICRVLPHPDLRQLAGTASTKTYLAGETLVIEGDPANHVFNITDGVVMLARLLEDGRRQVLGFLFKGDFLGLSQGAEYGCSVHALTTVRLCRFPNSNFRRFLLETPKLETELLSRASDELRAAQTHIMLLGRKTATERVASFLIFIAERESSIGGSPDIAFLHMTRSDIADYLGLTIETVSRVISALKRQGIIQLLPHGAVRILKHEQLEAASTPH
jgi:CRP/FNR family transcriptional regulator